MQKESYLSDVSVTSQTHPGSHKGTRYMMPPTFDLPGLTRKSDPAEKKGERAFINTNDEKNLWNR